MRKRIMGIGSVSESAWLSYGVKADPSYWMRMIPITSDLQRAYWKNRYVYEKFLNEKMSVKNGQPSSHLRDSPDVKS